MQTLMGVDGAPDTAIVTWTERTMDTIDGDDTLRDFHARDVTLDGIRKRVYVTGQGPGVIVMAEMPGISPHVARFARWVRAAGFSVYMPSLFGRDGAVPRAEEGVEQALGYLALAARWLVTAPSTSEAQ
jgi:dienelactone hydrolase